MILLGRAGKKALCRYLGHPARRPVGDVEKIFLTDGGTPLALRCLQMLLCRRSLMGTRPCLRNRLPGKGLGPPIARTSSGRSGCAPCLHHRASRDALGDEQRGAGVPPVVDRDIGQPHALLFYVTALVAGYARHLPLAPVHCYLCLSMAGRKVLSKVVQVGTPGELP